MSGETTIQTAMQTALLALAEYDTGDVFIDDWERLDGPTVNAPYAQILTADDFDQRQDDMGGVKVTWEIPLVIYVRWQDWNTAYQELRDTRQATLEAFRNNGGFLGDYYLVSRLRNNGQLDRYFAPFGPPESDGQLPTYIFQRLIVTVVEEIC